jgi:hypothetical protein
MQQDLTADGNAHTALHVAHVAKVPLNTGISYAMLLLLQGSYHADQGTPTQSSPPQISN